MASKHAKTIALLCDLADEFLDSNAEQKRTEYLEVLASTSCQWLFKNASPKLQVMTAKAEKSKDEFYILHKYVLRQLSENHSIPSQKDDKEILVNYPSPPAELVVILHNIRSAHNIGSILRTCAFFGCQTVFLSGYTANSNNPKVAKTMLTEQSLLNVKHITSLPPTLAALTDQGYCICAAEITDNAKPLESFLFPKKTALIMANERYGLESSLLGECSEIVQIEPRFGKKTLNVSNCFSIICYEYCKQWVKGRSAFPLD